MDNIRLFYRGINTKQAITHYNGFLPKILNDKALELLCCLQSGQVLKVDKLYNSLEEHNILIKDNGKYFSRIPLLTYDLSLDIEQEVSKQFSQVNNFGESILKTIAKNIGDEWDDIGHAFVGQLVIGLLWYNMWQRLSPKPAEPNAVIIADIDINHSFYAGIYPLLGNDTITYWQSTLLGHPDTIVDILYHKNVVASLQTINDDMEFLPHDNALVLLKQLNMYKNRTGENSMPVPYVTLPSVDWQMVNAQKIELRKLAQVFYNNSNNLEVIANKFYQQRYSVMKHISYANFRQLIYLVFSYWSVQRWLNVDVFSDIDKVKDKKRKLQSPTWQIV